MTPKEAVLKLKLFGLSDHAIAVAVGVTQPTIYRLRKDAAANPSWTVGNAVIEMARRTVAEAGEPAGE